MSHNYDIIIAGAGPAGANAALVAARSGCKTLVIDSGFAGGATGSMHEVLDFPGAGDKPSGEALVKRMRWQARDTGAEFREMSITSAALAESGRQIFCNTNKGEQKFQGRCVILATGCGRPTDHLVPGEDRLLYRGVSYSLDRDLSLALKQDVAVFGKNEESANAALTLARTAKSIKYIIPSNKLEISDQLVEQLKNNNKIEMLFSASIKELRGEVKLEQAVTLAAGKELELNINGIWIFQHERRVYSNYLTGTVDQAENGTVLVDNDFTTSIPGVFACGDILTAQAQIAVVAAAQGVHAGLAAVNWLKQA